MESIDNKIIRNILDKYFDALTTLEEEQQLRDYFAGNVASDLIMYKPLFNSFSCEKQSIESTSKCSSTINHNPFVIKSHSFFRWGSIAAAVAIIFFTIMLLPENDGSLKLTIDGVNVKNNKLALSMAESQLSRVNSILGKYEKSSVQLENLNKVGDAISPLTSLGDFLKQDNEVDRLNSNN